MRAPECVGSSVSPSQSYACSRGLAIFYRGAKTPEKIEKSLKNAELQGVKKCNLLTISYYFPSLLPAMAGCYILPCPPYFGSVLHPSLLSP